MMPGDAKLNTKENSMKALARFGKAFGGYKMIDVRNRYAARMT